MMKVSKKDIERDCFVCDASGLDGYSITWGTLLGYLESQGADPRFILPLRVDNLGRNGVNFIGYFGAFCGCTIFFIVQKGASYPKIDFNVKELEGSTMEKMIDLSIERRSQRLRNK